MPKNNTSAIKQVCRLHADILGANKKCLAWAIRIGELLLEIQKDYPHGKWGSFIEKNLPFARVTASKYMLLARSKHRLKPGDIESMWINEAAAALVLRPRSASANSRRRVTVKQRQRFLSLTPRERKQAEALIAESESFGSDWHTYFEWNNVKAGHLWRLHQAKQLLKAARAR